MIQEEKKCLVVSRAIVESQDCWNRLVSQQEDGKPLRAFITLGSSEIEECISTIQQYGEFRNRYGLGGVEHNPDFQQIIFYGMILRGNEFFVYTRGKVDAGKEAKEDRLSQKLSVGLGGHIEPFDSTLIDSLFREIDEEAVFTLDQNEVSFRDEEGNLLIDKMKEYISVEIRGLIKNDSDNIGKDHVGLFCIVRLYDEKVDVTTRDTDENDGGHFVTIVEYEFATKDVEPEIWTQLVMENLTLVL